MRSSGVAVEGGLVLSFISVVVLLVGAAVVGGGYWNIQDPSQLSVG